LLEANQIKNNLLRMIHCKEFSKEAQEGMEPSLVLVVPDVICENCQRCFDLDICRDPLLNASELEEEEVEDSDEWRCQTCGWILSKPAIERRLIDLLNRRLVSYQLQDLKCKNCKMVKNSVVSPYCECTGEFEQTMGHIQPEKLRNQNLLNQMTDVQVFFQMLRNFAQSHQMAMLQETAEQVMEVLG